MTTTQLFSSTKYLYKRKVNHFKTPPKDKTSGQSIEITSRWYGQVWRSLYASILARIIEIEAGMKYILGYFLYLGKVYFIILGNNFKTPPEGVARGWSLEIISQW